MTTVFSLREVTLGYDDRRPAVSGLSGCFASGSLTAIVGPNGGGKSTLLKGLVGLLAPLQGRLERGDLDPTDIAYLPQQAEIDRGFPVSVIDTVILGHWRKIGLFHPVSRALRQRAEQALEAVGLDRLARRPIGALSAGQFQRVLFARMLVQDCAVMLLDEPFAAIDARTTADLLQIVTGWHDEGRTVVAVLHDVDQVREHFPDTLLLARESLAWGASTDVLQDRRLRQARQMAQAWDDRPAPYDQDAAWPSTPR
ncbi:MAG: ABC transporter ATP-binding protein [Pseudomonadota bacterium]